MAGGGQATLAFDVDEAGAAGAPGGGGSREGFLDLPPPVEPLALDALTIALEVPAADIGVEGLALDPQQGRRLFARQVLLAVQIDHDAAHRSRLESSPSSIVRLNQYKSSIMQSRQPYSSSTTKSKEAGHGRDLEGGTRGCDRRALGHMPRGRG